MAKSTATVTMTVHTRKCPACGDSGSVTVDEIGFTLWHYQGWPIQEALGEYSPSLREQLMTGFHPECWDEMFVADEDGGV